MKEAWAKDLLCSEISLANDQHFADIVAGEKELDRGEIPEKIFDVAIIKYSLQAEGAFTGSHDVLHLQHVLTLNVIPVAG